MNGRPHGHCVLPETGAGGSAAEPVDCGLWDIVGSALGLVKGLSNDLAVAWNIPKEWVDPINRQPLSDFL